MYREARRQGWENRRTIPTVRARAGIAGRPHGFTGPGAFGSRKSR